MIEVQNLSKEYQIAGPRRATTMRDVVSGLFDFSSKGGANSSTMFALKDVSFEVAKGETVGIIGNNGAGKSTLLKILSRIIQPTGGEARLYGRTGSLLEVGTGFHRELTGRENVYLNGSILGMKRKEIEAKYDQIVEFAEIEEFLETPIKHYSSGMFTRLAFSVAAHLEPEILIVDEVLAVGDLAFQRKCMDKMRDVNKEGRTILFVSHNMQAITRVCDRSIWIDDGQLAEDGPSEEVVSTYLKSMLNTSSSRSWDSMQERPGNEHIKLNSVALRSKRGSADTVFDIRSDIEITLSFQAVSGTKPITPGIELVNEQGVSVFTSLGFSRDELSPLKTGSYQSTVVIPGNLLSEGHYFLSVQAFTQRPYEVHFSETDVAAFMLTDPISGDSARGSFGGPMSGVVRPILKWTTEIDGT